MSSQRIALTAATIAALLAGSVSSCTPDAAPAPDGVGPATSVSRSEDERKPLDLARPNPEVVEVRPAPSQASAGAVVPPAPIGPDIADLGPFDVLTWDEARARAVRQIQPQTAAAELERLRAELENQP